MLTEALRLLPVIRILVRGKDLRHRKHYRKRMGICGQNRLLRTIRNFRVVRHFCTLRSTCANSCGMYQMTHLCDSFGFPYVHVRNGHCWCTCIRRCLRPNDRDG